MRRRLGSVALGLLVVGSIGALLRAQAAPAAAAQPVSFANDVAPILERSCLSCHGETMQMGKLDLRTRETALRGGTRGADLVPRDAEGSRLYRRVAGREKPAMPAQGAALTASEIDAIKRWIDTGAEWDAAAMTAKAQPTAAALAALESRPITAAERNYWAFKLPVQAPLPGADSRVTNPVDRFLDAARQQR